MSYVEDTKSKDEQILLTPKLHWMNYLTAVLWMVIAVLLVLATKEIFWGIVAIYGVYDLIALLFVEMACTNKRVVEKHGIIMNHTEELKNEKIESVEIRQSILGRIFGYGTLRFSGTGTSKIHFKGVQNIRHLKSQVDEILE